MHKCTWGHQATKRNMDTQKKACKKALSVPFSVLRWEAVAHKPQHCDLAHSAITDSHNTVLAKVQGITGPLLKYVYNELFYSQAETCPVHPLF